MKAFAVKLEGLLEEDLVLDGPLVGERREVGQIEDGTLEIVFVPEEHAERLFAIVAVFVLRQHDVVFDCAQRARLC